MIVIMISTNKSQKQPISTLQTMTSLSTAHGWGYGVELEPRTRSEHNLKTEREKMVCSRKPMLDEIASTEMYRDGIAMWYWDRVSKQRERENEEITGSKDICWATYLLRWGEVEYCDDTGTVWGPNLDDGTIDFSHPLVHEFFDSLE